MVSTEITTKIAELIRPTIEMLGLQLWGCELVGAGPRKVLRIYIDSETGVGLNDCEEVSEQIGGILDIENPILGGYSLEVSSPGLDRRLFEEWQFEKYIGNTIKAKLIAPINGRRNYTGIIDSVVAGKVTLKVEQKIIVLNIANIERAKLVSDFRGDHYE